MQNPAKKKLFLVEYCNGKKKRVTVPLAVLGGIGIVAYLGFYSDIITHRIQVLKIPFKHTEIILHSSSFDPDILVFVVAKTTTLSCPFDYSNPSKLCHPDGILTNFWDPMFCV